MITRKVCAAILAAVILAALFLTAPAIGRYIDNPRLVSYFNGDEGGMMDLIWYYYSGERRESFQWDYDYGLELRYIADIARLIPKDAVKFTPVTFVFIIRWFHLLAWITALIALWRMVGRHFGRGWIQAASVLLLGVRPAFAYFSINLKPEPLVLLLLILGLDYTLRLIERGETKYLILASVMMVCAFLVKFAGIFLAPALVAALYFAGYRANFKYAWLLPALSGAAIIGLVSSAILFYVRKSTGMTWFQEFGFLGSIKACNSFRAVFMIGIIGLALSMLLFVMSLSRNERIKKTIRFVNIFNSYGIIIGTLFTAFLIILGFRWIVTPQYFLLTYSQTAMASQTEAARSIIHGTAIPALAASFRNKMASFDPLIVILFVFYAVGEIYLFKANMLRERARTLKRLTLAVFTLPVFALMPTGLRFEQHHMLPFFVAASVLGLEGIRMWYGALERKRAMRNGIILFCIIVLGIDLYTNACVTVRSRLAVFRRAGDAALEADKWMSGNVPSGSKIASDFFTSIYISPRYRNIRVFNGDRADAVEQVRSIIKEFRPQYLYYNTGPAGGRPLPPIDEILPGVRLRLLASFSNKMDGYVRCAGDNFVIYEVLQ